MKARPNSPDGHAAAGLLYGRRGVRPLFRFSPTQKFPPVLSNAEREALWRDKYRNTTLEQQIGVPQ